MSATRPGQLLRRLAPPDPDDGPLLARFAADRDPAAFTQLVRRHGPVVLAVCRRVTGHPQDAEDAFQAVFLILARKAGGLRDPGRLGNWLYGVAAKVASRARRAAARRRVREVQAVDPPDPAAPEYVPLPEVGPALHEELAALPAHYREPIVLCDLQGASRAEAAKALGVPEGTLSSRLANGRKKLADRFTRRGVVLSAAGIPAVVAEGRAAVPESLVQSTCGVVAAWAAGTAVPAAVVRLAAGGFPVKGVLLGGLLTAALAAGAVVAGAGIDPPAKARPVVPPVTPQVAATAEEPREEQPAPPAAEPREKAKEVKLTTSPRLREPIDLPVRNGRRVVWSPAGDELVAVAPPEGAAMMGPPPGVGGPAGLGGGVMGGFSSEVLLFVFPHGQNPPAVGGRVDVPTPQHLVGFTPSGKQVVLIQRESGLVSGKHRAAILEVRQAGGVGPLGGPAGVGGEGGPGGPPLTLQLKASFDIDPEQTDDFAFSTDGKSYRTLVLTRDGDVIRRIDVRRVGTESGKTLDTLRTLEGTFATAQLTADGKRVVTFDPSTEAVQSVPVDGGKEWQVVPKLDTVAGSVNSHAPPLGLSRDGSRVLAARGFSRMVLIDGKTGTPGPALEGTELVQATPAHATFSADGRLVAVPYSRVEKKEARQKNGLPPQISVQGGEPRLGVWDTTTGKLVRSWAGRVTAVAFHPTRPVLAVLEPNGAQTRLGLWDFAAE